MASRTRPIRTILSKNPIVGQFFWTKEDQKDKFFRVIYPVLFLQDIIYYPITHPEIKKFWVEEEYITVAYSVDETKLIEILTQMMRHLLQLFEKRNLFDGFLPDSELIRSF